MTEGKECSEIVEREISDLFILQLADKYGVDPEEIEHRWSQRSVERLRMLHDARALAHESAGMNR